MKEKELGGIYLECLIGVLLIMIIISPTLSSFYYLKKGYHKIEDSFYLENEIEKIRSFYKKNGLNKEYLSDNKQISIEIKKELLIDNLYEIKIIIKYKKLMRESSIYVYK